MDGLFVGNGSDGEERGGWQWREVVEGNSGWLES